MLSLPGVVVLALSCVFLADALPAQSNKIKWVDCSKHVPSPATGLLTAGLDLSNLPSTLHCGQVEVPMDYAKPISPSNNITLGLAMYRPTNPKGVLFYCPGGTDAGAVVAWQVALNQTSGFMPNFSGLEDFDLMVMDIRGTWTSNQLDVSLDLFNNLLAPYPTNQSEFDTFRAASATMIESFVNLSSPTGIVQFTGTREVVQDYESIRKALGYDKINFLGASYGSYRAVQYATTYPHRVGRFVLDAIAPHGLSLYDQAQDEMVAVNRGLLRADAYCQNNASCPFHSKGKGSVIKAYSQLLKAAQNAPLVACVNSTACSAVVTPSVVQSGISNLLGGQPDFPIIFEALGGALAGNAIFFALAGGPPTDVSLVVAIPYICSDYRIKDNTFSGFQNSIKAASKFDLYKIGKTPTSQIRLFCSAWPYDTAPTTPLSVNASMLLVTADFDVSTPTEKATFAWNQAPNSALVVRHGDDHVSFNLPDQPSTSITKEFLRTGVIPSARNETLVTVYMPGMHRGPIPSPYDVPTGFIAGDCATQDPSGCSIT